MKTPITYYGGKQNLAKKISSLIPEHKIYCEPFIGGGAIFFSKKPSEVEIINDTNNELINFYRVVQHDFVSLEKEILITLHSRDLHRKAQVIYNNPDMFDPIKRAWAVWTLAATSYIAILTGSYATDKKGRTTKTLKNKRESFTQEYAIRLQNVEIECTDALKIIRRKDSVSTFFYLDPPYYNSDMGHYDGYTIDDFQRLLEIISGINGKFLLSSYRSNILTEYQKSNNWHFEELKIVKCAGSGTGKKQHKIEVLTANFKLDFSEFRG